MTLEDDLADQYLERILAGRRAAADESSDVRRGAVTSAQARMFFLDKVEADPSRYHVAETFRVHGALDRRALERSLAVLVGRHSSLRSGFTDGAGLRRAVVDDAVVMIEDLQVADTSDETAVEAALLGFFRRPFDLAVPPLARAALLHITERDHLLCMVYHHIICDGSAIGVLNRELGLVYSALARDGRPPVLPPAVDPDVLPAREHAYLRSPAATEALAWWEHQLRGSASAPLPLVRQLSPSDGPSASSTVHLSAETTAALELLAAQRRTSLYAVICASVAAWVIRCTGETDLTFGAPAANRTSADVVDLVALTVNTIALRMRCAEVTTFAELVELARDTVSSGLDHQSMPFERVVERLAPDRHVDLNPLFQIMVAHQNVDAPLPQFPDATVERGTNISGAVHVDLEVTTWRRPTGLEVRVGGHPRHYDDATIGRIIRQLTILLDHVSQHPESLLEELPIMPPDEIGIIAGWEHGPAAEVGDARTVPAMFTAAARVYSSRPALETSAGSASFGELAEMADKVTRQLTGMAGPTRITAVALQRDIPLVATILGIMGTGSAVLALNLQDPPARRRHVLEDAGCQLVVTDDVDVAWLPAGVTGIPFSSLNGDQPIPVSDDARVPSRAPVPENVAYVMYTSGSSGRPKAVLVEHRNIVNTLSACVRAEDLHEGDLGLVLAAHTFDVFYHELFTPMLSGACVYLVTPQELFDHDAMLGLLQRASSLQAVPGLMEQIMQITAAHGAGVNHSLRRLMTGGDTVPPALLKAMRKTFPRARISITYGPTEAAIFCTRYNVPDTGEVTGNPLGRPLPGASIRVANARGERVPVGAEGEIWIGGNGVGRGYLNRPSEHAASFVERAGMRFYRTGDRARWRTTGDLEFLGRRDTQVKVRGARIELTEIAALAAGAAGVGQSVVVPTGTTLAEQRLLLYVTPAVGAMSGETDGRRVENWRHVFDDAYGGRVRSVRGGLDFTGWRSSFSGTSIDLDVMRDWLSGTVRQIRRCLPTTGPSTILEIGCGTGLVLLSLAPEVLRYVGTDVSRRAIFDLRKRVQAAGLSQVELATGSALGTLTAASDEYDVIVINSVVQYFPGPGYLTEVLDACTGTIADDGCIFVGDVRDVTRLTDFHLAVGRARGLDGARLREFVEDASHAEDELLLAPAWFEQYARRRPRITDVEIMPRLDHHATEMSRFRYDVVLRTGPGTAQVDVRPMEEIRAADIRGGMGGVRSLLDTDPGPVAIRSVATPFEPHADGEATGLIASAAEIDDLAHDLGWTATFDMRRTADEGDFDVLLRPRAVSGDVRPTVTNTVGQKWRRARPVPGVLSNDPARRLQDRDLERTVREHLLRHLPSYMVPATVIVLPKFPLTPNNKVDRAALPPPRPSRASVVLREPAGDEIPVAAAWTETLGHQNFSVTDDFFDIGGTSLAAIQLAVALRSRGLSLTPQQVFEFRTVATMAVAVSADYGSPESAPPDTADDHDVAPLLALSDTSMGAPRPLIDGRRILLTGATGMLGIHILHALLSRTTADIVCLVRAAGPDSGLARILDQYGWYFPTADIGVLRSRVAACAADLCSDNLTVALHAQHPGTRFDHVLHCAADVRHVADRNEVMAANVDGTRRVVDLVQGLGPVSLHHISTVGVAGWVPRDAAVTVLDEDSLDIGQRPTEVYSESKIIAEGVVRKHFAAGWEGSVLRVGTVAPNSRTGHFQRDIQAHFLSRHLRSILMLGITSTWPGRDLRLIPADLMATAVLELASSHAGRSKNTFHLEGTEPLSHGRLATILTDLGYNLRVVPPGEFPAEMDRLISGGADRDLVGGLLPQINRHSGVAVTLDSRRSRAAAAELGLVLGASGTAYVRSFIQDGLSRGFFPPPS
ncbi:non-ribosomal peptide synthetase [Pseudonocardia broussonetiae]|uniref:Amino acid adenylation domain-containing protein n=1 Tax=Pseudonocardia broussonetiae TaxID=2736640 RepID=A0A6M6JF63_9PSEU|nr:non-ribosomal peptide synthetase [Pseudonocardia broussonetiae]QJY45733.1 amino acid adenylation domain-containing protein [Pseudonocardia broussonetiae]